MYRYLFLLLLSLALMYAKASGLPATYEQAALLAKKATVELSEGNVKAADSLIKLSIKTYPVMDIFQYANALVGISDLNGTNVILDLAIARIRAFPDKTIYLQGQLKTELSYKEDAEFTFSMHAYYINAKYGNKQQIEKSAEMLKAAPLGSGPFKKYFKSVRQQAAFTQAANAGDVTAGIAALDDMDADKSTYNVMLSALYLDCGQYEKALSIAKENKKGNPYLFYQIYAAIGNAEQAQRYSEEIKKIDKDYARKNSSLQLDYFTALLELSRKDYHAAIKFLSPYIRSSADQVVLASYVSTWKVFTAMADAQTGIKEYEKARKYYELALLYNPDYVPAKTGIKQLEKVFEEDVVTDKTPPVITITEPSPGRGLKVGSVAANVMVKGLAIDPSGIKEITLNGVKVYAQTDGNFWGDVQMKVGVNKISVVAIDMAGNSAEKTFEIEKTAPPPIESNTPIVAVTEKTGKNYCLLIASQNYVDTSIPSLENPIADAVKLKIVLKQNYGFEDKHIISLFNPTGNDIKRQLLELTSTIQPEDNLLIFYAGHGIWVEKEKKGFWLMTDAVYKDVNTWTPNKVVLDLIAKLPARHTLLITDACFSGSVFKTRGIPGNTSVVMKELDSKITRVAITSGNDTEVPDESVFMRYLVKALSQNKEQYFTAQKMFITQILEAVMTETKTEPRYGTLELAGHVGGDYIFMRR